MTIDGMVELTVPKGAQPDAVLMLRGRGLPRLTASGSSTGRGNQLVHLKILIPTWVVWCGVVWCGVKELLGRFSSFTCCGNVVVCFRLGFGDLRLEKYRLRHKDICMFAPDKYPPNLTFPNKSRQ